jgi:hypothetical protein
MRMDDYHGANERNLFGAFVPRRRFELRTRLPRLHDLWF